MSGIGVISNPRARRNRKNPALARELTYVLGERGELHEPADLEAVLAVDAAARERAVDETARRARAAA